MLWTLLGWLSTPCHHLLGSLCTCSMLHACAYARLISEIIVNARKAYYNRLLFIVFVLAEGLCSFQCTA